MIIYFNKTKKEFSNQYFENSSLILTFYLIYLTTLYIRLYLSSSFFLNLPAVNRPTIEVKIAVALVANGATSAVFGTTLFSFSLVFSFVLSVVYPLFVEELAL